MKLPFYKYEGAGNDFVLIDNRSKTISLSTETITDLCNRNTGIGGDGLMLIEPCDGQDFYMRYYNSDGSEVGMCGNGGRCISLFAHHLGIGAEVKHFLAKDGAHTARILSDNEIEIKLLPITKITQLSESEFFLNSGVPHYVAFVDDIKKIDVESAGRAIRYDERFAAGGGTNANFAQVINNTLIIRTYERGVEGETLACGTGATASAVAAHYSKRIKENNIPVRVLGGDLEIGFNNDYTDVTLTGAARMVFKGEIEL